MCVINYLVSKMTAAGMAGNEPGLRTAGPEGRDEVSIREILDFGRGAEEEGRELPETRRRLGWK